MICQKQCLFILGIIFYINTILNAEEIVVNTNTGKVSGKEVSSIVENLKYYSFLGIPYAKPPINELRFMVRFFKLLNIVTINLNNFKHKSLFCFAIFVLIKINF